MNFLTLDMVERAASEYQAADDIINNLVIELEIAINDYLIPRTDHPVYDTIKFGNVYRGWSMALASSVTFDIQRDMSKEELTSLVQNLATMLIKDTEYLISYGYEREQVLHIISNKYKIKIAI